MTSDELKALRARLGLTQAQAAQKIGCALSTYARWEQHPPNTPLPILPVYRRALAKLARRTP